jgi:hypothetical protein
MNPADPKIDEALRRIQSVYAGQNAAHAYYDPANQLYVLVVSGVEAEGYQRVVKAVHSLSFKSETRGKKKGK